MSLRAIVFDFDGVIANSEPLHLRAFRDVLAQEGVALAEPDYYARYLGFDDVGVFRKIGEDRARTWNDAQIGDLVSRKGARFEGLERDVSMLFPGAADAVRRAAAAVPVAIASGARGTEIRRVLDREGLTASFAAIVAAEDTAAGKPSPDPYLHAVARLSSALHGPVAARDCVAIEDSEWGLESARTAGLRTVGVAHMYPAAELSGADLVLTSIDLLDVSALQRLCS